MVSKVQSARHLPFTNLTQPLLIERLFSNKCKYYFGIQFFVLFFDIATHEIVACHVMSWMFAMFSSQTESHKCVE
jgi:hypothetical protein